MISGQFPLPIHPKKPHNSSMKSSSANRVPVQGSRIKDVSQQLAAVIHASNELFKKRKKDVEMLKTFEEKYGTFRNCYKNHLKEAMSSNDYENYLPCLMVLNMHYTRHKAMSTIGRCKLAYEPGHIKSQIGMHAMHHYYPGEKLSLFEEPEITSNTDLILLAQSAKK